MAPPGQRDGLVLSAQDQAVLIIRRMAPGVISVGYRSRLDLVTVWLDERAGYNGSPRLHATLVAWAGSSALAIMFSTPES